MSMDGKEVELENEKKQGIKFQRFIVFLKPSWSRILLFVLVFPLVYLGFGFIAMPFFTNVVIAWFII